MDDLRKSFGRGRGRSGKSILHILNMANKESNSLSLMKEINKNKVDDMKQTNAVKCDPPPLVEKKEDDAIDIIEEGQFEDVAAYKVKLLRGPTVACVCGRGIVELCCHKCYKKFTGRPNVSCPVHANVTYLMDLTHCPSCRIEI